MNHDAISVQLCLSAGLDEHKTNTLLNRLAMQRNLTVDKLSEALHRIYVWETPKVIFRGELVSMAVAYGSNGERDYFRGIARQAVERTPADGQTQRDGAMLVSNEVLRFLNGSGEIEGVGFGERHPKEPGLYWWRKRLPHPDDGQVLQTREIMNQQDKDRAAIEADRSKKTITIYRESNRFFHEGCPASPRHGGIMKETKREPDQWLIKCLQCGQQGYYPYGNSVAGSVRVPVVEE